MTTSFDACMKLYPNTGKSIDQLEYARVIGLFMCAVRCTRPYIASFAIGKLSGYA
jgi:hypothetical protein